METQKVKCNCICHTDKKTMHMMPCCDNGWIEIPIVREVFKIPQSVIDFIQSHGTVMTNGETTYLFLPFWIEMSTDSPENTFGMHQLGSLPDKLKNLIEKNREFLNLSE